MERVVYKYALDLFGGRILNLRLPEGAEILSVGVDWHGRTPAPMLWALVNPAAETVTRRIAVVATGAELNDVAELELIGRLDIGHDDADVRPLRLHVFEVVA